MSWSFWVEDRLLGDRSMFERRLRVDDQRNGLKINEIHRLRKMSKGKTLFIVDCNGQCQRWFSIRFEWGYSIAGPVNIDMHVPHMRHMTRRLHNNAARPKIAKIVIRSTASMNKLTVWEKLLRLSATYRANALLNEWKWSNRVRYLCYLDIAAKWKKNSP